MGCPVRSASTETVLSTSATSLSARPRRNVTAPRWWRCNRLASSRSTGCLGSVATPWITSWWRATPSDRLDRSSSNRPARRVTAAAAGASDGWPSGYMACLWRAIDSSIRKSARSRDRVARSPEGAGMRPKIVGPQPLDAQPHRSEEHTSELQSLAYLVCRLLLEKKTKTRTHFVTANGPDDDLDN